MPSAPQPHDPIKFIIKDALTMIPEEQSVVDGDVVYRHPQGKPWLDKDTGLPIPISLIIENMDTVSNYQRLFEEGKEIWKDTMKETKGDREKAGEASNAHAGGRHTDIWNMLHATCTGNSNRVLKCAACNLLCKITEHQSEF